MRVVLISDALRPQLGGRRRLKKPTDDLSAYFFLVEMMGIEPTTSALRTLRSPN